MMGVNYNKDKTWVGSSREPLANVKSSVQIQADPGAPGREDRWNIPPLLVGWSASPATKGRPPRQ